MDSKKPSFYRFKWNYVTLMIASLIPTGAFFLYFTYREKGYLAKSDWIVIISVSVVASIFLLVIAYYINQQEKDDKDA